MYAYVNYVQEEMLCRHEKRFATNVNILVSFFTHILINWQYIPEKIVDSSNQDNLVLGHLYTFYMYDVTVHTHEVAIVEKNKIKSNK